MDEVIIRELGGGAAAILVTMLVSGMGVLALVIRTLWIRYIEERDKSADMQSTNSRDIRELHLSTLKTLNDVERTMSSLAATMRERRREDDR